jgi:RNA polymerase sigma-70 factor (ECF subfamily)
MRLRRDPPRRNPIAASADFASFYEESSTRVFIYFLRRVPEPEVATDLTAETFAQALVSRASFRGSTTKEAGAWLFGIARHQLTGFIRKGRIERKALDRLGIPAPALTDEEQERAIELADSEGLRAAVQDALAELSIDQQEALRLRIVDELGYPEVAGRLRISNEAARARVHRGLRALASSLSEFHNEEGALR